MYYNKKTTVFHDGQWMKAEDANANLFDQTLHYGTGVLDGLRAYKNTGGFNIFQAQTHFKRLQESARKMKLKFEYSVDELVNLAYELVERNQLENAYIRPLIYSGSNMRLEPTTETHFFMGAWKWAKFHGTEPLNVMVSSYVKPNPKALPIDAKVVGNYASSVMASSEAKQLGYDEALLLDHKGNVAEGPGSNFFYEKNEVLYTPKTGTILPGITRATIFQIAKETGTRVVETDISPADLETADYAFFCGTASEISPIVSVNGESLKGKSWEESASYNIHFIYQQKVLFSEYDGLTIV
ncbi:MAG: branched-chain-amino-acid transaminase [Cyclobacteriaceae bacterium]|nr:branched-chain-amino-acid transaminase [Cyclobacteriaceae bacterium HetDA_MAG_MS6]